MNTPPRKQSERGMFRPVWREFNRLIDYVREIQIASGRNVKVTRTMNGTMLLGEAKSEQQPQASGDIIEMTIMSVSYDHYVCFDGANTQLVAKNFKLRRSPFSGGPISYTDELGRDYQVTYNYTHPSRRSATINEVLVEYQVVIPRYRMENEKIYVMRCDVRCEVNGAETTLSFIDVNADGRAWARAR